MTRPRSGTVAADAAGYYHCSARCVRQTWLCGIDPQTGMNYEHRRGWVEHRLLQLADSFAVGLYAWAVMSNHSHVVLYVDPKLPESWTAEEVAERWSRIHRRLGDAETTEEVALRQRRRDAILTNAERLAEIRRRLGSISWFMRFLNEAIALAANAEDGCSGRFWEGRFACKALVDDAAVLGCMSYVDLNPIRAGVATDLDNSEFTSIRRRLSALADDRSSLGSVQMVPLAGLSAASFPKISTHEYVELTDWTGRQQRSDKKGLIAGPPPECLAMFTKDLTLWARMTTELEQGFGAAVGQPHALRQFAERTGRRWVRGAATAR